MGAILHEVSHNLQNELELERAVPLRDRAAGCARRASREPVATVWVRWNREIFGDMIGCMLGGEAFVASLMDVIGRAPDAGAGVLPARRAPHAVPAHRPCPASCCAGWGSRTAPPTYAPGLAQLYPSAADSGDAAEPCSPRRTAGRPARRRRRLLHALPSPGRQGAARGDLLRAPAPGDDRGGGGAGSRRASTRASYRSGSSIGAVRTALDRRLAPPERLMRNFYVELARR